MFSAPSICLQKLSIISSLISKIVSNRARKIAAERSNQRNLDFESKKMESSTLMSNHHVDVADGVLDHSYPLVKAEKIIIDTDPGIGFCRLRSFSGKSRFRKVEGFKFSCNITQNWQLGGGLIAKCYYAKKKIVWEILDGSLKSKIELHWSAIVGFKAVLRDNESGILEIEVDNEFVGIKAVLRHNQSLPALNIELPTCVNLWIDITVEEMV